MTTAQKCECGCGCRKEAAYTVNVSVADGQRLAEPVKYAACFACSRGAFQPSGHSLPLRAPSNPFPVANRDPVFDWLDALLVQFDADEDDRHRLVSYIIRNLPAGVLAAIQAESL